MEGYAQDKRKLWGIISAVKADKDSRMEVIIETDCFLILRIVSRCATPYLARLR